MSIQHTAVFRLKHPEGSSGELAFLKSADVLAAIPGVQKFEKLRQVSAKNNFTFCFSMHFSSQKEYDQYNSHPDHVTFVQSRWIPEVEDFMEIDYIRL